MPFKHKPSKTVELENHTILTLDTRHKEFLDKFQDQDTEGIPTMEQTILELKNKLRYKLPLDENLSIKDKIKELRHTIRTMKEEQQTYYLDNSKHIFHYFEEKKKISEGKKDKVKLLNHFFKIDTTTFEQTLMTHTHHYMMNVDDRILDMDNYVYSTHICTQCSKGELVPIDFEGAVICNNMECGCQFKYLIENEKPSYKEPPKEVCFYAYKRINHFREILAQFQAKESTQIPEDILENISLQIKKERMDIHSISNKKAKEILKKLGYNKFYEHIPFIKDKLGIKPPVMTVELEDTLCNLFMEIQRPYAKYCPDDRVNFLNYYYTIYKLCEILDQTQFLPCFPMLKDREKRIEQDEIWKKICKELRWEFIPTI
jgi:hypothetical protein